MDIVDKLARMPIGEWKEARVEILRLRDLVANPVSVDTTVVATLEAKIADLHAIIEGMQTAPVEPPEGLPNGIRNFRYIDAKAYEDQIAELMADLEERSAQVKSLQDEKASMGQGRTSEELGALREQVPLLVAKQNEFLDKFAERTKELATVKEQEAALQKAFDDMEANYASVSKKYQELLAELAPVVKEREIAHQENLIHSIEIPPVATNSIFSKFKKGLKS